MEKDFQEGSSALKELIDTIRELIQANKAATEATEKRKEADEEDENRQRATARFNAVTNNAADSLIRVGREFLNVANAGVALAETLGTTATQGVQTELNNRQTIFDSIFSLETDRMVSMQQLTAAQDALASTFSGVANGMMVDSRGVRDFGAALKGGFKSEFALTSQSMRALITAGVSTEAEFENLRKASGRASLNHVQLSNLVNKNSLSFMLYGPKFIKAAQEAEKLGISLASVQSAQESMVTNLDGTLDTLNQLNQLGAQIDFGTLTQLNEFQGPEATLKYLQSTIPPALFQSASTRALLRGFGISTEDLMKRQGSVQDRTAASIEDSLTKIAEPAGKLAEGLTTTKAILRAFGESIGDITKAVIGAIVGLTALITVAKLPGVMALPGAIGRSILGSDAGPGGGGSGTGGAVESAAGRAGVTTGLTLKSIGAGLRQLAVGLRSLADPRALAGLAAVTVAIIGLAYAVRVAAPGIIAIGTAIKSTLEGVASVVIALGTAIGTVITDIGATIGNVFEKLGTLSPVQLLGVAGAMGVLSLSLGGIAVTGLLAVPALIAVTNRISALAESANSIQILSNSFRDLVSSIEKLNTVDLTRLRELSTTMPQLGIAGGAAATVSANARVATAPAAARAAENTDLVRKVDELIGILRATNTVINIDNRVQEVPRVALAGVYSRNGRG